MSTTLIADTRAPVNSTITINYFVIFHQFSFNSLTHRLSLFLTILHLNTLKNATNKTHRITFDGLRLHVQVPNFDTEVISTDHVSTGITQFNVAYTGNNFRKKASICWILRLLEYFTMMVTQRCGSHIAQSYRSLATAVHQKVTFNRVKLSGRYHFRKFLHVSWLNVYYVCIRWIGKLLFLLLPRYGL